MNDFYEMIELAISRHASDMHLTAGCTPSCRINGDIVELLPGRLMPEETERIANTLMTDAHREALQKYGVVDFSCYHPTIGRFRVNVFRQRNSVAVVARILNAEIPSPQSLGIPQSAIDMIHKKRGLVLVTGPTGAGKTTTLASLINQINLFYPRHIITLEDPIEYLHHHKKSIVNQREIGADAPDFASALRAALRQDPDVILVGEMRDLETISTAVTAAETGHLIFSTLHTIGGAGTIDRIIDVFPPYQQQQIRTQLAEVLECVISQQLLPRADGKGMIAAMEVMIVNSAIRNSIRDSKTYQIESIIQTNKKIGMQTMDDSIFSLYTQDLITRDTALSYSQNRVSLKDKIDMYDFNR